MRSEVTWASIPAMVREAGRHYGAGEAVVDGDRRVTYASSSSRPAALAACGRGARRPGRGLGAQLARMGRRRGRPSPGGRRARAGQHAVQGPEAANILARSGDEVLFTDGFLDTDYPALLAESGTPLLPDLREVVLLLGDAERGDDGACADFGRGR